MDFFRKNKVSVRNWQYPTRLNGGAKGNRTPDLLNAIQTLSQLSYGPFWKKYITVKPVDGKLKMVTFNFYQMMKNSDNIPAFFDQSPLQERYSKQNPKISIIRTAIIDWTNNKHPGFHQLFRFGRKSDRKTVPGIDNINGNRQLDNFLIIKMFSDLTVNFIRGMFFRYKRQCFRP